MNYIVGSKARVECSLCGEYIRELYKRYDDGRIEVVEVVNDAVIEIADDIFENVEHNCVRYDALDDY